MAANWCIVCWRVFRREIIGLKKNAKGRVCGGGSKVGRLVKWSWWRWVLMECKSSGVKDMDIKG